MLQLKQIQLLMQSRPIRLVFHNLAVQSVSVSDKLKQGATKPKSLLWQKGFHKLEIDRLLIQLNLLSIKMT